MPRLLSSAIFLAIYDNDPDSDYRVQFATELGIMLLEDKPIILTYLPGQRPSERLCRIADELLEIDMDDPNSQDALADALRRVTARLDGPQ